MILSEALQNTLLRIADFLADAQDPWWVLGSAAMTLIGVDPGDINDVDLLVSDPDARALMRRYGLENQADGGTAQFKSDIFLLPALGDIRVEVMSGYQIRCGAAWDRVAPQTRQRISLAGAELFVPERAEQAALLERLGRPKDLQRLARLR